MRRGFSLLRVVLTLVIAAVVGVLSYQAGVSTQLPAGAALPPYYYEPHFYGFGLFGFLFLIVAGLSAVAVAQQDDRLHAIGIESASVRDHRQRVASQRNLREHVDQEKSMRSRGGRVRHVQCGFRVRAGRRIAPMTPGPASSFGADSSACLAASCRIRP